MSELNKREVLAQRIRALRRARWLLLAGTFVALSAVVLFGAIYGITNITISKLGHYLAYQMYLTDTSGLSQLESTAFLQLRLPRIVMGILAGSTLAICGLGMQVITGNRMASPFTTGIASAAAFGAALAMLVPSLALAAGGAGVILTAFVMAGLCSLVVLAISAVRQMGNAAIVLAGIAISYLFSALSAGMQYLANEQQLASIVSWTFGDLGRVNWRDITVCAIVSLVALVYLQLRARQLTLLNSGEATARSMGVPVRAIRTQVALLVTFSAAVIVSFTGIIGFVGLVAPHIASILIGRDLRLTVPMTAMTGAFLLVLADLIGRWIASPVIVPVGIVVSLVGVPIFVWLIARDREGRA